MVSVHSLKSLISKWKENLPGSALVALFIGAAFISALNKVRDSETWLHLSLGRLIWQMKSVPDVEVFTYPNLGDPFSYNSWLFGLLTYALESNFGAYGLALMKASVIAIAFYILLKDSLRPHRNYVIAALLMTAALLLSAHRFVIRPDLFLMLFLGFSVFSLNAYLYDGKKYLYALPVIHLLWANMHASILLMFAPFGAFIVGSFIHRYLGKKGIGEGTSLTNSQLKVVAIVFAASFAATLLTPYLSLHQYIYGPKYVSSDWHKKYIVEMLPPTGFDRTLLYIVVSMASASFLLRGKRISFIHLLLLAPFMVIPFISVRFKFLLAITAGPIIARNVSAFIVNKEWNTFFNKKAPAAIAACCVVLFLVLSFGKTGPFWIPASFGMEFDNSEMPECAIEYMDEKKIYGRMLNTFHFGQYITWTGYPERKVFIDARGHLPTPLLEKVMQFTSVNFVLDELYAKYGFQSILIELGERERPHSHPGWALVYWDDISLLYLKRGGEYDHIIRQNEYRYVNPDLGFGTFTRYVENQGEVIRELNRNIMETGSSRARVLLGLLYNSLGFYGDAINVLSGVSEVRPTLKYAANVATGDAYMEIGDIDRSIHFYEEAFDIRDNAAVLYKIALAYEKARDLKRAAKYLRKAISLKGDMMYAYPFLIDTYRAMGENGRAEDVTKKYMALQSEMAIEEHLERGRTAYFSRNYQAAVEEISSAVQSDPSNASYFATLGYVYLEMGQDMKAHQYLSKALEVDPENANAKIIELPNAHFGLAIIYRKINNTAKAREHLEEFMDIEPSGHYSRKAEMLLQEMSR